jgi:hypothetical protein
MSDDGAFMPAGALPRRRWAVGRSALIRRIDRVAAAAAAVFLVSLVYYGSCLFPGLGGELNPGDSAKFQILGHTSILVHGPGYPVVLAIGALVRALALPLPAWWVLTFALSAVPGAVANTFAFLITRRLTGSIGFGAAAALLLGSAGLVAVQATEAEVYALTLAFVLCIVFLLIVFVETRRLGWFLAACAVYAASFGNHLMMIMLLPLFLWMAVVHRDLLLEPRPVALAGLFILLGAAQYLFLAHVAYSPGTAYSEYMPLPPEPMALVHYILGTYFSDLYGSGLVSTRTLEALISTLRSAHPWVSLPLIVVGAALIAAGWWRRDARWRGLALVFAAALCFVPFVLWYGAYDIRAFHGPVLGTALVAAVAALGWWARRSPAVGNALIAVLLLVGAVRAGQTAWLLATREPPFAGLEPAIEEMVAQSPVDRPLVAMSYGLRMATLYHELRGELPQAPVYRVHWRAIADVERRRPLGGIVVPTDGYQFVRWIEHHRPDLRCRTGKVRRTQPTQWPAYLFECRDAGGFDPADTAGAGQRARSASSVNPAGA